MTPLEALGIEIEFKPGPPIAQPLRSRAAIEALVLRDDIVPFVGDALRIVRAELAPDVGLIGRQFLRSDPAAVHLLPEKLTDLTIRYVRLQIEAGADAIQLFDSWAGLYDEQTYR